MFKRAADNMTDIAIAYGNVMERNLGLEYEIGSLANQTADTVTNINSIVTEVNKVVSSMADIQKTTNALASAIDSVADSLLGITNTVTEATIGVTEIAGKTSDVVIKTSDNTSLIDDCMESVKLLKNIADSFITD